MNKLFFVIFLINILLPIYQIKAEGNQPPSITTITGINRGKIDTYYNYTFYATDPDNDDIYYLIHWGDSMVFYWMGPYKSGEKITISYCFQILPDIKYEELIISARAKDVHDACGEWGHFRVVITNYKPISFNFEKLIFEKFFINILKEK